MYRALPSGQTVYLCTMYTLSGIWVYPIKSLGGIALSQCKVEIRGLQYDRRWMLVNGNGRFMSQREIPRMALLRTALDTTHLLVYHKDTASEILRIPLDTSLGELEQISVDIWDDQCTAALLQKPINDWFSDVLSEDVRLVAMPASTHRWADGRYAPEGQYVSFADGYPYLIIGEASLEDLNNRLDLPVPMNRFRPNFVFKGGIPFEEDNWQNFRIGDTTFLGVKPCARCSIPTTDQETAETATEPIKTLASYRSTGKKILFGQNVVWLGEGDAIVRVGDRVSITS